MEYTRVSLTWAFSEDGPSKTPRVIVIIDGKELICHSQQEVATLIKQFIFNLDINKTADLMVALKSSKLPHEREDRFDGFCREVTTFVQTHFAYLVQEHQRIRAESQ